MYPNAPIQNHTVRIACIILTACPQLAISQTEPLTVEEVRERARQNELQRRQQEEQAQQQVQTRQSWLQRADSLHLAVKNMQGLAKVYYDRRDGLLHSDEGKAIARQGNHFISYIILKQNPPFSLDEIKLKVDEALGYLNQIRTATQGPEVGYVPAEATRNGIEKLEAWAKSKYEQLSAQISTLGNLLRYTPADVDLTTSETLAVAYDREQARSTDWRALGYLQGMNEAQPQVIATHQEATRLAQTNHASAAANAMLETVRQ